MTPKTFIPFTIVFFTACGPDLPENWEKSVPIDDFQQSSCEGDPYEDNEEDEGDEEENLSMRIENGILNIDYNDVVFRCEQGVEGFQMSEDNNISVLLQPKEMNPSMVAKCDCLYNFSLSFPVENLESYTVDLYTRTDRYGGDAELSLVNTNDIVAE